MAFIEHALTRETDDCIRFPFGLNGDGYANLRIGRQHAYGHVIVCQRAHGQKPLSDSLVAHSCRTPACVNKRHLRWATSAENAADQTKHGTTSRGPKLKPIGVKFISEELAHVMRYRDIGRMFGVSGSTVSNAVRGQTWKHRPAR